MQGTLYGVGVGPGDPELITQKAVRILGQCPVIAVPQTGQSRRLALQIAEQAVPALKEKEILSLPFPMTKNQEELDQNRDRLTNLLAAELSAGRDVAYLTLGDPTIYSTYLYLHQRILARGFSAVIIPGVPSFCAVAARLNDSLVEADQMLHIIPASYSDVASALAFPGTKVLMKMGKHLEPVKALFQDDAPGRKASLVQNCGLEEERVYPDIRDADPTSSYFSMIVVKEEET